MPRWLRTVLDRIRELAAKRQIRFTLKALQELSELELDLDEDDVCDVLCALERRHSTGRRCSERTGEWLYVFKPEIGGTVIYAKLILRTDCILVSFHEDDEHGY